MIGPEIEFINHDLVSHQTPKSALFFQQLMPYIPVPENLARTFWNTMKNIITMTDGAEIKLLGAE